MKLMILDGNSIVNRAYYGIRMLNAPDGTPTNGIYGFLSILHKLLGEENPEALCVAFDLAAPTFRHKQYEGYKAQRKGMPEELAVQMPILKEVLDAMGVKRLELEGYEADDILGTVAKLCTESGWTSVIVTGDKDSLQLVTENATVKHVKTRAGRTETTDYTPSRFFEEYGFEPPKMVDLKALMGDSSDNIPGVPGVGEKTALDLIRRFGSLEGVYAAAEDETSEIKAGVRKKLSEGRDSANMSFELATIITDVPLDFTPEQALFSANYGGELHALFTKLGFSRFIESWGVSAEGVAAPAQARESMERLTVDAESLDLLKAAIDSAETVALYAPESLETMALCDGKQVFDLSPDLSNDDRREILKSLSSNEKKLVSHNVKDLLRRLLDAGFSADSFNFTFDTALAAYLIEPTDNSYDLPRISQRYLGETLEGVECIWLLTDVLEKRLEELGMAELLQTIELPLCSVLAEMEKEGFLVDRGELEKFDEILTEGIARLEKDIYELAGEKFNINSPKQLGVILFERLMLPAKKKTKTGWSTSAEVLESLRSKHPIVEQVLDYRQLSKLKSTYCDGLLKVIAEDGRIHTSFQMTVTATGRLSSTEPNLQNIPVRTELGGEIRRMFVAPAGRVLVDADYSQIELRILSHISGDETMQNAFVSGEDIHTVTASQVFNLPIEEVTSLHRSRAKAVNFGIVYGISAFSLSQDIKVSVPEAKSYMEAYLSKYHGVRDYMKIVVEKAKEDGFVATQFGRRRPMPELKSSNFNLRSFGERVALNMPIQGTAADVIKLAMINVHKRLKAECPEAKLLLQVHDELIVECDEADRDKVSEILTSEMESAVSFSVPLTAEAHSGRSWFDAK